MGQIGNYLDLKLATDITFTSPFPQFNLLSVSQFINFSQQNNVWTSKGELEYFDRKNLIKPLVFLTREKKSDIYPKYHGVIVDSYNMVALYYHKIVQFYPSQDFKPWNNFMDETEESVSLYYHPYQFLLLLEAKKLILFFFSPYTRRDRLLGAFSSIHKYKDQAIERLQNKAINIEKLTPKVALLILLQIIYNWNIGTFTGNPHSKEKFDKQLKNFIKWKKNCCDPNELLQISGFSISEVQELYKYICRTAQQIDPLALWYPLLQLINRDRLGKLKNNAALAQEYYKLARILKVFLFDVTKEEMPEPDDIADGSHGVWKEKLYGKPFNYYQKKIQGKIRDHYFRDPDFKTVIVIEGETEEAVIKMLLKALRIDNKELIFLRIGGQGNFKWTKSVLPIFKNPLKLNLLIILDKDKDVNRIINECKSLGVMKKDLKIWRKDFEYDNFGLDAVVDKINELITKTNRETNSNFTMITKTRIKKQIKGAALVKTIENEFGKKNQEDLYKTLRISKPGLSKLLFEPRYKTIRKEVQEDKWKPKLPIEKQFSKLYRQNSRWRG